VGNVHLQRIREKFAAENKARSSRVSFGTATVKAIMQFLRWLFNNKTPPTKEEIAALIDLHLGTDNGRDDGRIIRVKTRTYHYYITRSPVREERR